MHSNTATPNGENLNYNKGDIMSKNSVEVEVKVNGEVVKAGKKAKNLTALEECKKYHKVLAHFFNQDGKQVGAEIFKSEKDAQQRLAAPEYVGCTVVTFKQSKVVRQKLQFEEA